MNTSQYTIRGIPNAILKRVDSESKRTKRSKNEILLRAITNAYMEAVTTEKKWYEKYHGTMSEDDAKVVEAASRELRQIHPKDYL